MPVVSALRALLSLAIAAFVALFAVNTLPPENIQPPAKPPAEEAMVVLPVALETPPPATSTPEEPLKTVPGQLEGPTQPPPAAPVVIPQLSTNVIETQTRGAVVHLLCTTRTDRSIRIITGSGVIIDPRGVVLTNAHVAQFWLFPEESSRFGDTGCSVRATIPIDRRYHAELLYLPEAWVREHAVDIENPSPRGTGEDDYALLRITEPVSSRLVLPVIFPFVTYSTSDSHIDENDSIFLAAYPATDQEASARELESLSIVSTTAFVEEVFTFNRTTLDLISLGASQLSFKGSSGGAVMDEDNRLIGLITTSTEGQTAAERKLRAITLAHVNRSLLSHTGISLDAHLSGNLETKSRVFAELIAPRLSALLLSEL
jgi:hypothetical protein